MRNGHEVGHRKSYLFSMMRILNSKKGYFRDGVVEVNNPFRVGEDVRNPSWNQGQWSPMTAHRNLERKKTNVNYDDHTHREGRHLG